MMNSRKDLIRQLPELDELAERLADDTKGVLATAFPAGERRKAARGRPPGALRGEPFESFGVVGALPAEELPDLAPAEDEARRNLVEAGRRAINKIRKEGEDVELAPAEKAGLEAIVAIEGRPAILIQDGHFFPPPEKWKILEQARPNIEKTCRSVGRIEVDGHPSLDWIGTGFLVAKNVIMTNRHVAKEFCRLGLRRRWGFEPGMTARIDYVEEFGALNSAEYHLKSVIGVHENYDLALFRAEPKSSQGFPGPEPLAVSSNPPVRKEGEMVYTVGYPAWDGRRNDPEIMRKIFSNIFDVKRLQPGEIVGIYDTQQLFIHDCSTLGGNSGSCVVDLATNRVVGLHFGGRYLQGNQAIALWELAGDPLIKKARVNFQ